MLMHLNFHILDDVPTNGLNAQPEPQNSRDAYSARQAVKMQLLAAR